MQVELCKAFDVLRMKALQVASLQFQWQKKTVSFYFRLTDLQSVCGCDLLIKLSKESHEMLNVIFSVLVRIAYSVRKMHSLASPILFAMRPQGTVPTG